MKEYEEGAGENVVPEAGNSSSPQSLQTAEPRVEEFTLNAVSYGGGQYWANLKCTGAWSEDGREFEGRALSYQALDNGQPEGNIYLSVSAVSSGGGELTGRANQNGSWHPISGGWKVDASGGTVRVLFRYNYDRAGVTDVEFQIHKDFHYKPNTPVITASSGIVPDRQFKVRGTGGVYTYGTIIVRKTDATRPVEAKILNLAGDWEADFYLAENEKSVTFHAIQVVNGFSSGFTPSVTVTLLTAALITTPKANDIVEEFLPVISGTGHERANISIYQNNIGSVIYGTGPVVNGVFNIKLTRPLPQGAFVLVAGQVYAGATKWSNLVPITVRVKPLTPVITRPLAGSTQNSTFTLDGTGGEAGAIMEVFLDFDHTKKVGEASVTGDSWSVPATVDAGRVSLVCKQTSNAGTSEPSDSRYFDIRPRAIDKVDVTYLSAISLKFSGPGLDGAMVDIRVASGPGGAAPPVAPVEGGKWETRVANWPFGTYQLRAIQKVSNGDNGWIEAPPYSFPFTHAVPVPYEVTSTADYQPTISGEGVYNAEVSFYGPDEITKVAADVRVGAADTWSRQVFVSWGPTYKRKVHIRQAVGPDHSAVIVHEVTIPPLAPVIDEVKEDGLSPLISGKCWLNAQVELEFNNDGKKFPATVNGETWSYRRTELFEPDVTHSVKATQFAAQQTSPPATETFRVFRPMITPVIVYPEKGTEVGRNVRVRGTDGMKGATVYLFDVRFTKELGRTTLTENGPWTIELTTLAFDQHTVEVLQKIDERESARSAWHTFIVALLSPYFTSPLPGRTLTRNAELEGQGLPEARVDVFLGDASDPFIKNIFVGPDGYWRVTAQLPVGTTSLRAKQYFEDQISKDTSLVTFRVVPLPAFLETPASGEHVGGRTVVSGFGVPGDTATVMLGDAANTVLGETTVQGDGTWSVAVDIDRPGGNVDLVVVSSLEDFVSAASPARSVRLGTYKPDIATPSEGQSVSNPVTFAGQGRAGVGQVASWFNPEVYLLVDVPSSNEGWRGEASSELPVGGYWAVFHQTLTGDPGGAELSDRVQSARFEVVPQEAKNESLKAPDERSV